MKNTQVLFLILTLAFLSAKADTVDKLDVEMRVRVIKMFDLNGDGMLDAEERAAANEALEKGQTAPAEAGRAELALKRFDANGDGELVPDEFAKLLKAITKESEEARIAREESEIEALNMDRPQEEQMRLYRRGYYESMKAFDLDNDGVLSDSEIAKMYEKLVARVKNLERLPIDGIPEPERIKDIVKSMEDMWGEMSEADSNEFVSGMEKAFDMLRSADKGGKGYLDNAEIQVYLNDPNTAKILKFQTNYMYQRAWSEFGKDKKDAQK